MCEVRRGSIALVVVAVLAPVTGCKTVEGDWHSTTELSDALLTVTDLGDAWRETQRDVFDLREPENPVLDPSYFCPAAEMTSTRIDTLAGQSGADVEMRMKDSTRMMRLQAWNNTEASKFFELVSTAVTLCDGAQWTDESVGVTTTLDEVEGPKTGSEAVHWLVVHSPPANNPDGKFGGSEHVSVVRFDGVIMLLQVGDYSLDPAAASIADDDWWVLVALAAKKIDDL